MIVTVHKLLGRLMMPVLGIVLCGAMFALPRPLEAAQPGQTEVQREAPVHAGGEASLVLPDLSTVDFRGINGRTLLMGGLVICALGLLFGLLTFKQLKQLPVHASMLEVSELIYETCKTYLITQGKFILILELFIGVIMVFYFGVLERLEPLRVVIILLFSLIGIAGSYGVAWFGIRVNTFANSRAAFASLRGKPFPIYAIPLRAGMSIGMLLISVELLLMLCILLFIPGNLAGPCFIGFAIGESLGAAALRIAGGIFTKIADIGSDLMKIVFNIKEDDARNPGVIADCTGDNAGDSVGPSADGFETYGVTGVALISFILLAVAERAHAGAAAGLDLRDAHHDDRRQRPLLFRQRGDGEGALRQRRQDELRGAADHARLADLDRLGRHHLRRVVLPDCRSGRRRALVEAVDGDHLRHAGRRDHPGGRQGLHLHRVGPRQGGRDLVARGRAVAEHPVRVRRRQLQRLLAGHGDRHA